jgi:hypothetical protein
MAYIDVLPLDDVKLYLRIDDTLNDTDAEITSMINSAFRYIEKTTNILVYARSKEYDIVDGEVKVYDHPINSVTKGLDDEGTDVTLTYKTNYYKTDKSLYTNYYDIDGDAVKLVLNVGYTDVADVEDDIIELAKVMVKVMYYEQESNQTFKEMLPSWAVDTLNANRRYLL